MTSKERVLAALNHQQPDQVPVDFGGNFITGIHCSVVEQLRDYYGLEKRLVKVCEPYQMLGEVEDDLKDAMGVDVTSIFPNRTLFGFVNENWKEYKTWWGQTVLVSEHFETKEDDTGTYIYAEGDRSAPPSAHMPTTSYFFDTIIRQEEIDEDNLKIEDNLEEFKLMTEEEAAYWESEAARLRGCDRAVITHLNGTSLGDIALVPAPFAKKPKGIRDITQWYMTIVEEPEFVSELFERQSDIAIKNMERLHAIAGDVIDVVVVCGTDFGTQDSTFCSSNTYNELWQPHYKKINDWIHENTDWKTFKHSCGAVETFMNSFINSGFDAINPVQCSAAGMDPQLLKDRYGDKLTFWGGGVNTQQTLPFGTPEETREEVLERCRIFSPNGGFVFNAIHNVQALSPIENVVAMIDAVKEFNGVNPMR